MILKGISVNQDPPTKDYLWITPKGNTRFWNQSTWMLIGGNGGGGSGNLPVIESAGKYLVTTGTAGNYSLAWGDINLSNYINGTSGYAAVFNGNNSIISAIGNNSKIRIGNGIIEWDSTNSGFKIYNATSTQETPTTAGIYADWVSALGPNSSGGGGGGSDLDWGSLITWDEDPSHIINIDYLPVSLNNDVITIGSNSITPVTSVAMTVPTGFTISGSPITKTGTLALGYNNGYEGFTTDLKNKINDLYSWFEVDSNGNVKTKDKPNNGGHRGFYSESFISALGLNSSGGGGGGGISETDLWIELTDNSSWLTTDPKIIARNHLPINGASGNSGGQTFYAPTSAGSSGQFLVSNGSGAPSWTTITRVTGVKGDSESTYRTGNVNITKSNIGLGNVTNDKQLPIAGGTMTGVLIAKGGMYEDAYNGALNMNNSDIYGLNSIYTANLADSSAEGIHFYRTATTVDSIWVKNGVINFTPNRTLGTAGTSYTVLHSNNYNSYSPTLAGTGATGTWGISISGNAATATILQTTRTINGTNFNGSANITTNKWGTERNISISDADGTNTGDAVSVNGSENKTLKLPSTIKASLNGTVNGYSISSTVNSGTANRLAYYTSSGIDDASTTYVSNTKLAINSTSEPSYNLYVYGTADITTSALINNITVSANTISSGSTLYLDSAASTSLIFRKGTTEMGRWNTNSNLIVGTPSNPNNITNKLYVNGTSYFDNSLNINSAINTWAFHVYNKNASATTPFSSCYIANGNTGSGMWLGTSVNSSSYYIANFRYGATGDGAGGTSALYVRADGNVGIGTESPACHLHSSISTTGENEIRTTNSNGSISLLTSTNRGIYDRTTSTWLIATNGTDSWLSRGNVGIGTTTPPVKLSVAGDIYASGGVTALQAVSSDKRLKKNIKKFNAKDIIDKLNPVSFEWNSKAKKLSDFKDGTNYGLIAQDSDGIIDNLVFDLPDNKGYKGVRYEKLIPILLQAVKEQQKEIDELKQIIKKLKV